MTREAPSPLRRATLGGAGLLVLVAAVLVATGVAGDAAKEPPMNELTLSSAAFQDGETIPKKYTCEGEDRSPPLQWSGVPEGTKSFALATFDPDAPRPEGWVHWAAHGLPASAREVPEGAGVPPGAVGVKNDFGKEAYGGPCPPPGHGPHRYQFTLFALSVEKLEPAPKSYQDLVRVAEAHALATARLTGMYERKKK